ncbi:conserved hypothetical protein [delta proteobacterium NaphS2]|nr:conserved hypothetical protein [delta proteobacterium NaphS2]
MDNIRWDNVNGNKLRAWLTRNGYPWREDMLKSELSELCTRLAPAPDLDGHLKIPHLWPGQNPPATGRFQFTNLL